MTMALDTALIVTAKQSVVQLLIIELLNAETS